MPLPYVQYWQELSQLRSGLKWVPSLRPRYLHLLAYFYAQGKNWKRCQHEIEECAKVSMKQGNSYEYQWSQYNWGRWSGATRPKGVRDSIWLSYSDGHVFDWTVANKVSNEVEFYPWPVPSKMVSWTKTSSPCQLHSFLLPRTIGAPPCLLATGNVLGNMLGFRQRLAEDVELPTTFANQNSQIKRQVCLVKHILVSYHKLIDTI